MFEFITGPLLWLSFLIFFLGLGYRVFKYIRGLDWKLERVAYAPHRSIGLKGALSSIYRWLIPFGTYSWRQQPYVCIAFFMFHAALILVPLFLLGHNVMWTERFGFSLPSMPMPLADALTICGIIGAVMLGLRRIALPEVRILTTAYDWFVLGLCTLVLVAGFTARLHTECYDFWLFTHILSAEAVLILAPFTKLSHIVLYFMSRGQLGMDFAIKRGGAVRGPAFPW